MLARGDLVPVASLPRFPMSAYPGSVFFSIRCVCFASLAGASATFAQTAQQPTAGDQAWDAVKASSRAAAEAKVTKVGIVAPNKEVAATAKAEREARAQKFRAAAQSAKDFHTQHPTHAKAAEARRVEVLSALEGITPTDKVQERAALATASAFRTNRANPISDRFQVAHAMESREIAKKLPGRPWFTNPVRAEMMLDRLRAEFGERPEVWGGYLALAENTYCDAGRDVAYRIVQSSHASEPTKAAARRILERYTLVRKPLDFPLAPTQGRSTTLAELAGKTTVVCLWDGAKHPEGPPGLHDYKKNSSPNTKWVYISVGALGTPQNGRKANAAPPGVTCVEPLGWRSPVTAKLQVTQLPCVFVLDEKKQLSGYGRIDEIPALMAGIGRPVLP